MFDDNLDPSDETTMCESDDFVIIETDLDASNMQVVIYYRDAKDEVMKSDTTVSFRCKHFKNPIY
jgi:hypothetical protein